MGGRYMIKAPFIYNNKEYSIEDALSHLLRREINTYGKALRSIIYSCCPASVTGDVKYDEYYSSFSKNKTLVDEIQALQDAYYYHKFSQNEKFRIIEKLKNNKGKKYSIYDYFTLETMHGYYELLKGIVTTFNFYKPNWKAPYTPKEEQQLWELYITTRNSQLEEIRQRFPKETLHHDFTKSPVVANKENQRKINAMYEWLGFDGYKPQYVPTIVETYIEDRNQTIEKLSKKINKIVSINNVLDDKRYNDLTFYNPKTKECMGSGEPYYEIINDKKVLAGYITSDGEFVPKENINEYTDQSLTLSD